MARSDDNGAGSAIGRRRRAARKRPSRGYTERKVLLLGAAARVFQEKGFEAVRMDDIAQQLGVDRATLYYYFGNKQQLFREVIIEALTKNVGDAKAIAASELAAREKLRAMITALLDSYDRLYPLFFVYVQEDMRRIANDNSRESKQLVKLGEDYETALRSIIVQGVEEGEFSPTARVTLTAYAIIGAANWAHRWFTPSGSLSGQEVGEEYADLFLNGLLVGPARRRRPRRARAAATR